MDILFLTPQPIYQDRGSPIAVDLVLRVLSERKERVDVVTYHEGQDIVYDHINIYRIPALPFVRNIRAGFSWKKVVCDIAMLFRIIPLIMRNRYQLIYAVEEAVFFALLIKFLLRTPYVYDMDSSLAQQMVEQMPWLRPLAFLFNFFEGLAVKHALTVVPVCDALATDIEKYMPQKMVVLHDVSLLDDTKPHTIEDLSTMFATDSIRLMYVGNLQEYQGIDLLLSSFALALQKAKHAALVIIGGTPNDIAIYQRRAHSLGIGCNVHFLGPRPLEHLTSYLAQADILISPRIKGKNTPMKLYSYLHSGKPLVVTNLQTHTQVVNHETAMLAEASPATLAEAIVMLIEDETLRIKLGAAGKALVEQKYSYGAFRKKLNQLFDWLRTEIDRNQGSTPKKSLYPSTNRRFSNISQ